MTVVAVLMSPKFTFDQYPQVTRCLKQIDHIRLVQSTNNLLP